MKVLDMFTGNEKVSDTEPTASNSSYRKTSYANLSEKVPYNDTKTPPSMVGVACFYIHIMGWSVILVSRKMKKPVIFSWKEYQTRLPIDEKLEDWFLNKRIKTRQDAIRF